MGNQDTLEDKPNTPLETPINLVTNPSKENIELHRPTVIPNNLDPTNKLPILLEDLEFKDKLDTPVEFNKPDTPLTPTLLEDQVSEVPELEAQELETKLKTWATDLYILSNKDK